MTAVTFVSFLIGGTIGCYVLLRFLMYVVRKVRGQLNGATEIALSGFLVLVIATVGGGYGMQDELPEPQFIRAFSSYFGPAMLTTVIELVRLHRRS